MIERARELYEQAEGFRASGELALAGDAYTRATHEFAGDCERSFPEPDSTHLALGSLLDAATCYRVASDEFRVQNRCELGAVIVADHQNYVERHDVDPGSFADLRRGVWSEFLGDLRTIAGVAEAGEAYEQAIEIYEAAGDFELVYAEQEHTRLAAFFRSIRRGAGEQVADDDPEQLGPGTTFSEWVEYKRTKLPALLQQLEESGRWPVM